MLYDVQFKRDGVWQWLGVEPQGVSYAKARQMALKFAGGGAPEVKAEAWRVRPVDECRCGARPTLKALDGRCTCSPVAEALRLLSNMTGSELETVRKSMGWR